MVLLLKLIVITSLLVVHIAEGNIGLTANHKKINPLSTMNFILNCTYGAKNSLLLSLQVAKVLKNGTSAGVLKQLVSMTADSKIDILSPSTDVKYTGGIQGKGKAYLSGRWNRVPKGFGGIYLCTANIMDGVGHLQSLNRQIQIVEEKTKFAHSVGAIKELQTSEQKLQMWKESMVSAFQFLDRAAMKTSYSGVYKNKYYIAYKYAPFRVRYAEDFCRARGGYLAELNDRNEWKFVAAFMKSIFVSSRHEYYVSGRYNRVTKRYYWPRKGKWRKGYFKLETRGNPCIVMCSAYKWELHSQPCNSKSGIGFICEMPKNQ